jgi:hypothetical protein
MKMKKILFTIALIGLIFSNTVNAQSNDNNDLFIGFQLNQFQQDFGLGINVASPAFLNQSVCLRLRANAMFHQYVNDDLKSDEETYSNIMLGFSSASYKINDAIALYGEGGAIAILPSSEFSSSSVEVGGYGIFGFEFYFYDGFCYFLEAGGIGSSASADELPNAPIYSNGFLMSVGFKIRL